MSITVADLAEAERWLPVPGYAGWYEVSDRGNVMSLPRAATAGGLLRPQLTSRGYRTVALARYGRVRWFGVGQLVLLAFRGRPQPGRRAWHGPGGKADDSLENLSWDRAAWDRYCPCPDHRGPNPVSWYRFPRNRARADGLDSWCKACANRSRRGKRAARRPPPPPPGYRRCPCPYHYCERVLPVARFGRNRSRAGGVQAWCTRCRRWSRVRAAVAEAGVKRCGCLSHPGIRELPLSLFHRDNGRPDGLAIWCRDCTSAYHRERRRAARAELAPGIATAEAGQRRRITVGLLRELA